MSSREKIDDEDVLWKAHPGRQTSFLSAIEYEVLYGGAAGGGKTAAALMAPLRYVKEPDHHAIIFRATYPELEDMINKSRPIYSALGGTWRGKCCTFPSGARISFGNLPDLKSCYRYHGPEYTMLFFDELCSWPTDEAYVYMQSRLRKSASSNCRLMIRATCNPNGPGKAWVQAHFRVNAAGDEVRFKDEDTGRHRRFIPAKIDDNPSLAGSEYEKTLSGLPKAKRAALRDGRWDAMEGAYYPYIPIHEFKVQPHWRFFGSLDFGWAHRTAFILTATDDDGHIYVIDTWSRNKTPITSHAAGIKAMCARHGVDISQINRMCGGNDLWARRNEFGTMADTYNNCGFQFQKAIDDRINGWQKLIELFGDPHDEENPQYPRMSIHPRNKFLIQCLPLLQHDPNRPEDVLKMDLPPNKPDNPSDDECDSLRYNAMMIASSGGSAITTTGF